MNKNSRKKLYSVRESYSIFYDGFRSMKYMSKARKLKLLNSQFIERLMIAVTAVNDCPLCSYAHSKMALETGMDSEEIQNMLSGEFKLTPSDEQVAVLFAQHYADSRGKPSPESWERLVRVYGSTKSKGILGAIRAIMIGNVCGIPWGSFFNRFRGKSDKRSNILYEISIMSASIIFMPVSLIHAFISNISKKPIINFKEN